MIRALVEGKRVVDIWLICNKIWGLFTSAYGEWLVKDNQMFDQFKVFWKTKCDPLRKTGEAAENDDDQSFKQTVDKFAKAHNAT